jgi:hypothetical protein
MISRLLRKVSKKQHHHDACNSPEQCERCVSFKFHQNVYKPTFHFASCASDLFSWFVIPANRFVIPAKAGIQFAFGSFFVAISANILIKFATKLQIFYSQKYLARRFTPGRLS